MRHSGSKPGEKENTVTKEVGTFISNLLGGVGTAIIVSLGVFAWWWLATAVRRLSKED